ncbi:peptidase S8/S53 domain-containing protein [Lophiotrema nucula]|uniref:Peptidase S8/S53 domain-containing protein n=1 Tax=Lophiotrema nucula TaxID=690887 RepID=A0A6A5YEZ1_9PLEO|nr:peptidase S8/S53 domain-containing protein [Lophiotrema nucula]
MWGMVFLDGNQVDDLKDKFQGGIKDVEEDQDWGEDTAIKFEDSGLLKRAGLTWEKQDWTGIKDAPFHDLIQVSQYKTDPETPLSKFRDYVHEKRSGEDTYIYVVDQGVEIDVEEDDGSKVFDGLIDKSMILQTDASEKAGHKRETDQGSRGHGTMVAAKASSAKYGVAKKANIIPVKAMNGQFNSEAAWQLIFDDLKAHPDRAKKSVIVSCVRQGAGLGSEMARSQPRGQRLLEAFRKIHDLGVPIVFAAGNARVPDPRNPGKALSRDGVDMIPYTLEGQDCPLIVVGAASRDGTLWPEGQRGPHVTIFAPGEKIATHDKNKGSTVTADGTSGAAPIVAGLIATYMNYDPPPWGQVEMGRERVEKIKEFLKKDETSWERNTGERIIWNGADKAAHDSVGGLVCKRRVSKRTLDPRAQAIKDFLQPVEVLMMRDMKYASSLASS